VTPGVLGLCVCERDCTRYRATSRMSSHAWTVGAGLLLSLTLMGSSRKVFGDATVKQYLVPHRADIGVATFFNIGFSLAVQLGLTDSSWAPGGPQHLLPVAIVQLGYLQSLIDRRDFGLRLALLVGAWLMLAVANTADAWQAVVGLEIFTLWIVKLFPPSVAAQTKPKRSKRSKMTTSAPAALDEEAGRLQASPARPARGGAKSKRGGGRKR